MSIRGVKTKMQVQSTDLNNKARCSPVKVEIDDTIKATSSGKVEMNFWKEVRKSPAKVDTDSKSCEFGLQESFNKAKTQNEIKEKKEKYSKKSYGKRKQKVKSVTLTEAVPGYTLTNFPVLGGDSKGPAECLELELNAKAHSKSREKMAKMIDAVAFEEGKVFSYKQKGETDIQRFMQFYMKMIVGEHEPVYRPGEPGFVLFRTSAIRYVLTRIAEFNPEPDEEVQCFLKQVVHLNDKDFAKVIPKFINMYTLEPQGWWNPFELKHNHSMNNEQFDFFKELLNQTVIQKDSIAREAGENFASGLFSQLDFGSIFPAEIWQNVNNILKSLFDLDVTFLSCLSYVAFAGHRVIEQGFNKKTFTELGLGGFVLFSLLKQKELGIRIRKFFETLEPEETNAQAIDESSFLEVITGLFGVMFMKDYDGTMKGFCKSIKGFSTLSRDLESIVVSVVKLLEKFGEWVCQKFLGVPSYKFFSEDIPGMEKWIDDVNLLLKENMEGKLLRNISNAEKVMELEKIGQGFLGTARTYEKSMRIREKLRPILHSVTYLRLQFEQAGIYGKSVRPKPVFIMLHGGSQIGKTEMLRPLTARIMARCMPEKQEQLMSDFESLVYAINPESEYWEGYLDHAVLMIDEYSIAHPSKTTASNMHTTVIKCKNSFPYMLNMARAEAKGSNYFRGRFMLGTSNIDDMYADAQKNVNCPIALTNRIDFDVRVCVKKEYATEETQDFEPKERALDKSKIPASKTGFFWGLHDYYLIRHKIVKNEHLMEESGPIDINELLRRIEMKYKEYKKEADRDASVIKEAIDIGLSEGSTEAQVRCYTSFNLLEFCITVTNDPQQFGRVLESYAKEFSFERAGPMFDRPAHEIPFTADPRVWEMLNKLSGKKEFYLSAIIAAIPEVGNYIAVNTAEELGVLWILLQTLEDADLNYTNNYTAYDVESGHPLYRLFVHSANTAKRTIRAFMARVLKTDAPFGLLFTFLKSLYRLGGVVMFIMLTARLISILLVGLFKFVWSTVSWLFGTKEEEPGIEKVDLKESEEVKKVSLPYADLPDLHVGSEKPQSHECSDREAEDLGRTLLKKNIFEITFGGMKRGKTIFLKDNIVLMNAHYLDMIVARTQPGHSIVLTSMDEETKISATREEMFANAFVVKDLDLMVLEMPHCPKQFPDITKKFIPEEDMKYRTSGECIFVRAEKGILVPTVFQTCDNNVYSGSWNRKKKIELKKGFRYGLLTRNGECGSPILLNDVGHPGSKIFGIHSAGNEGGRYGICSSVSREQVESMIAKVKEGVKAQGKWDYEFKTMKVIREGVYPNPGSNSRSSIIRSPLYGAWGPAKKDRAKLQNGTDSEGVYHDVMLEALIAYDDPLPTGNFRFVEVCVAAVMRDIMRKAVAKEEMRVIPLRVAIEGKVGTLYEPLPRDSSGGFPHNAVPRPGWSGKTRFLGKDHTVITEIEHDPDFPEEFGFNIMVDAPDWDILMKEIKNALVMIRNKQRPEVIYTGCMKDELRKLEKVLKFDTRYFSGSPLFYLILFKMFFGSFFVFMLKNKVVIESCVGVNPYSDDWDMIARDLLRMHCQFAGDFRKFDKRQMSMILWAIGVAIRALYHDEYDYIREALWYEMVRSRHIVLDMIIEWSQSLPSGHPFTIVVNTLYVMVLFRMLWLYVNSGDVSQLESFSQHHALKAYGDDVLAGISEYAAFVYDSWFIPDIMIKFGMEFTAENKEERFDHVRKLEDCTFLKRGFRYEPLLGRYVAPLSLDTVLEMPYWTKRTDSHKVLLDNISNSLCELALHDEETFRKWSGEIAKGINRRLHTSPVLYPRWVMLDLLVGNAVPSLAKKMRINIKNMEEVYRDTSISTTRCVPVKVTLEEPVDDLADTSSKQTITSPKIEKIDFNAQGADTNDDVGQESGTQAFTVTTDIQSKSDVGMHIEDTGGVKISRVNFKDLSRAWTVSGDAGVEQVSIAKFLGKPYLLGQYIWSTQSAADLITSFDLPEDYFALTMIKEKVKGFKNIRGTFVLDVMVNGTPFQAGRLICHYQPQAQVPGMYPGIRNRSLTAITQQPRVELDLNCDSTVRMKIPYTSPFPYYSVSDQTGVWGRFYVRVYSPLATGVNGSTSAEVSVYCHMEDVEIVTPTYIDAQGADKNEEESEALRQGTISGALNKVSKISASLARVPFLTDIASPVAWASGILSGAAAAFGYSKPANESGVVRVTQNTGHYMSVCDGDDTSQQLGTFGNNRVEVCTSLGGTDLDEANILHLCQIPAFTNAVEWNVSHGADTSLYAQTLVPSALKSVTTYDTTHKYMDCIPASYFHYFFSYWRGSMRLRLKIVKTAMHSGKLQIIYAPGGSGATSAANANYCMREVIDIRTKTEWEFVFPYVSNKPYQESPPTTYESSFGENGIVTIRVLNTLQASTNVESHVILLLEWSAGPDFELANPRYTLNASPFTMTSWLSAQGADDGPTNECDVQKNVGIGGSFIGIGGVELAALCEGEKITSIYQLLKRFVPCGGENGSPPHSTHAVAAFDLRPFSWNILEEGEGTTVPTNYPQCDYVSFFSPCFVFSRGGMRFKGMRYGSTEGNMPWFATQYYETSTTTTGTVGIGNFGASLAPAVHNNFGNGVGIEVAIPQYTRGLARLIRPGFATGGPPCDYYDSNNRLVIGSTDEGLKILYRAVADDFQLGFFLGVPALSIK